MLTNDNTESRKLVEQCYKRHKTNVNPIIEWTDSDVWDFIKSESIPYCELYNEGFTRLGCVGCPLAKKKGREREFMRWPKYKDSYIRAFGKMLEIRKEKNRPFCIAGISNTGITAMDVFNWLMEYDVLPGQLTFDDMEEDDE